jgi:hypothetical protein
MWINLCLGDYRFRHSGVAPRPVSTEEVLAFLAVAPRPPCVFQGASLSLVQAALNACGRAADVRFDISRLTDATGHLDRALSQCGLPNLVMGSEFPLRDMREVWWTALRQ